MYLLKRNSIYYFRARVPEKLWDVIKRKEVCFSLLTKDRKEAISLSGKLLSYPLTYVNKYKFGLTLFTTKPDGTIIKGDFDTTIPQEEQLAREWLEMQPKADKGKDKEQSFSIISEAYLANLEKQEKKESAVSCKRTYSMFLKNMGDLPMTDLTQGRLGAFSRVLDAYKKRDGNPLAAKTTTTHIKNIVALSNWAASNFDGIVTLTSRGITPRSSISPSSKRALFTQDDINMLLGRHVLLPEELWLIRLGAFTGARIQEIAQLNLNTDVLVTTNKTYYLNIIEGEDQKVKTHSGVRKIPLHPQLIELGLLEWFESQVKAGFTRPFESRWKCYEGKWGKYPSKWFGEYKSKIFKDKYDDEQRKKRVFHSFRHTLADHFKKAGVAEPMAAAFLGHATTGITYSTYAKGLDADDLAPLLKFIPEIPH